MRGYVQLYTGKGKGKTTASFGLTVRALGAGLDVYMIQFMKGRKDSAFGVLDEVENFDCDIFGKKGIRGKDNLLDEDYELAEEGLDKAMEVLERGEVDVLVLEEINVALEYGLIGKGDILDLIDNKPEEIEIVMTGRYAPEKLIEASDLVTEMKKVKHYFDGGTKAREGIDY
ncbi:MAG: ATP:corrinoid adenosyltransferase BtuR [Candidatus Methanohalarchaeum thermophilum]|uniref:ATP:corrinoid adenosyltransferase BtuR n=1 Tax=Methanohalarchaeum thermophilum TaxID=1903181 RepID=A0A1Q6DVI1_METT1|nr:MAG: ATP:corrinoid adenosyltransferase BtuR [Candidatus Methanohalarchaeum thermophilum]